MRIAAGGEADSIEEIAVSLSIESRRPARLRNWVVRAWQVWRRRQRALAELADREQLGDIARDVGLSRSEVCILAGKWPDSSDLLSHRLEQVSLDSAGLKQTEPQVLRDLQRTCGLCASKRMCSRDFARRPSGAKWEEYCPNAGTIRALLAERHNGANRPFLNDPLNRASP
jgi:uncharacterized protein YjiS (DUF1127 family)